MKKYLMTGITALAICVGFTSCSNDIDALTQEELNELNAQKIIKNYEKAFEATFGKPAANQTWGFGDPVETTRTRRNLADGNEWGAPTNDPTEVDRGWIVPDTLTDGQRLRVTRYFQTHPYLTYVDPQWTNFFVQQVYTGGTNVLTGNESYKNKDYAPSPEVYRSADKLSTEAADITSNKLNYLFAYGETEHINNFNGATASYKPVLETGEDVNNGKKHNDRINLMYESSTYDFSYQNAYSSVRHGQPYVALAGAQTIDEWADSVKNATGEIIGEPVYYGTSYSGKPNSYWNRSFLGCDLELLIGEEIYAGTNMKLTDASSLGAQGRFVNGEYTAGIPEGEYMYNNQPVRYLKNNQNQYGGDLIKLNDSDICYDYRRKWTDEGGNHDEYVGKVLDTKKFDDLLKDGYLPVAGTNLKNWVKPLPVADHYYSDWIVTLTEAKRQNEIIVDPTSFSLRVMAEDLSATERSDYDFNDVVFDVVWKVGDNYATIYLKAAGGTLPLRIGSTDGEGGIEVHEQFGVQTNIMVNTHWAGTNGVDGKTAQPFTVPFSVTASNADAGITTADFNAAVNTQISVEVEKLVNSSTGEKKWFGLYANQGQVCCKFGCPTTYNWVSERTNIDRVYQFSNWVQGFTTTLLPANQTNN